MITPGASVSSLYAVARPYKLKDIVILFLLEPYHLQEAKLYQNTSHLPFLRQHFLGVPHMVLIFHICYVLAKKAGITKCLNTKCKNCVLANRCTSQAETEVEFALDSDSLPDQLINGSIN